jgi:hypothetical protein
MPLGRLERDLPVAGKPIILFPEAVGKSGKCVIFGPLSVKR